MKPKKDNTPKIQFECIYKCRKCNEIFANGFVAVPSKTDDIDWMDEMYINEALEKVSNKTTIHRCEGLRKPVYGVAELIVEGEGNINFTTRQTSL